MKAAERKLKARESDLLGRFSVLYKRAPKASASAEVSPNQQSAVEREVAFLRYQLSGAASTFTVDIKSIFASDHKDLGVADDTISK